MNRTILILGLSVACAVAAYSQKTQTQATGDASNSAELGRQDKSINLETGTRLAAELQHTLDVRKAKVGDQVILKTSQSIKSQGRTVVGTGARLIGQVTEVTQKGKGSGESRVAILFDRLERGSLAIPITATISSITNARTSATMRDDLFENSTSASGSARSSSSVNSSSNNAGLLGGVGSAVNSTTSTVGTTVGATTSAVGSPIDSTANVAGSTTTGIGRSLGRIQISESSNASFEGGSVLSLPGDNLRLEKGTRFNLLVTQSASAGTTKDQ
jgi:phenylpyruvate tautomerase PptA (4-oxalocrotonate tautomerase family)